MMRWSASSRHWTRPAWSLAMRRSSARRFSCSARGPSSSGASSPSLAATWRRVSLRTASLSSSACARGRGPARDGRIQSACRARHGRGRIGGAALFSEAGRCQGLMLDAVGQVGRAAEDVLAGRVVEASAGRDVPSRVGLLVQRQLASAMAYHQPLDATVPNGAADRDWWPQPGVPDRPWTPPVACAAVGVCQRCRPRRSKSG